MKQITYLAYARAESAANLPALGEDLALQLTLFHQRNETAVVDEFIYFLATPILKD